MPLLGNVTPTDAIFFLGAFVSLCFGVWQWQSKAKIDKLEAKKVVAEDTAAVASTDASKATEASNMMQVVNIVLTSIAQLSKSSQDGLAMLGASMTTEMQRIRMQFDAHAAQDAQTAKEIHQELTDIKFNVAALPQMLPTVTTTVSQTPPPQPSI